jgi:hypothetical protein
MNQLSKIPYGEAGSRLLGRCPSPDRRHSGYCHGRNPVCQWERRNAQLGNALFSPFREAFPPFRFVLSPFSAAFAAFRAVFSGFRASGKAGNGMRKGGDGTRKGENGTRKAFSLA